MVHTKEAAKDEEVGQDITSSANQLCATVPSSQSEYKPSLFCDKFDSTTCREYDGLSSGTIRPAQLLGFYDRPCRVP
jgi:hypothetical protein